MEKKPLNKYLRKELISLPVRKWDVESEYDSVLLLSTGKKHDSGWAIMIIIGVVSFVPTEIAVHCCDDIEWKMPDMKRYGSGLSIGQLRMDCAYKSGALHAWSENVKFKVGIALSSTTIELTKKA